MEGSASALAQAIRELCSCEREKCLQGKEKTCVSSQDETSLFLYCSQCGRSIDRVFTGNSQGATCGPCRQYIIQCLRDNPDDESSSSLETAVQGYAWRFCKDCLCSCESPGCSERACPEHMYACDKEVGGCGKQVCEDHGWECVYCLRVMCKWCFADHECKPEAGTCP